MTGPAYKPLKPAILFAALGAHVLVSVSLSFIVGSSAFYYIEEMTQGVISVRLINSLILIAIVLVGVLMASGKVTLRDMGLRSEDVKPAIAITLAVYLIIQVVLIAGGVSRGSPLGLNQVENPVGVAGGLIGYLLGSLLYEELFFRGVLLVQLGLILDRRFGVRGIVGWGIAILVSQAIYATTHVNEYVFMALGVGPGGFMADQILFLGSGVVFAILYLGTGNLLLCIGLHALQVFAPPLVRSPIEWTAPFIVLLAIPVIILINRFFVRRLPTDNRTDLILKPLRRSGPAPSSS